MQPSVLFVLGLAAALPAQSQLTVPATHQHVDAPSQIGLPGLGRDARMQVLVDASLLSSRIGQSLTGVSFRVDADNVTDLEPATGSITVRLGAAATTVTEPSSSFAANLPSSTTVFQGSWTADPVGVTADPWDLHVDFATPYPYAGGSLVLELEGSASAVSGFWAFDAVTGSPGQKGLVQSVGVACGQSGPAPALVGARDLRPGGSPRFVCLGEVGALGTLLIGNAFLPTPIDLSVIGFPGCTLQVQSLTSVSVPIVSFLGDPALPGVAQVEPLLPFAAPLYGVTLTAQWVNFGTRLEVSNALQLQLAAQPVGHPVALVHGAPLSPTGTVSPGFAPVLRFDWQ